MPKRCGHLKGKQLISAEEMAYKIKAATDARQNDDTVIVARTDAIAVTGFDDAVERAQHYLAAGADMLFVEAPENEAQMASLGQRFGSEAPCWPTW